MIGGIFSSAAICWLFDPSAAAKTMRLRCANDWGVEEEWTNLSKVLRVWTSSWSGSATRAMLQRTRSYC